MSGVATVKPINPALKLLQLRIRVHVGVIGNGFSTFPIMCSRVAFLLRRAPLMMPEWVQPRLDMLNYPFSNALPCDMLSPALSPADELNILPIL